MRKNEDETIIKYEAGVEIQDAISTLIFAIAKHFLGDPSKLKDRSLEILANLRCKKF